MRISPALLGCAGLAVAISWPAALASPFYDYDIIAKTGVGAISDILPGASINEKGEVAFVGRYGDDTFQEFFDRVIRWDPISGYVSLSINDGSTVPYFTVPQLKNDGQAASSLYRNGSVLSDFPRASLYGPAPGTESIFAQYSTGYINNVSVNNVGDAVFERFESFNPGQQNQVSIVYHKGGATQNALVTIDNFSGDPNVTDLAYYPRISDDDTTVMRSGDTPSAPVTAYKSNGPQVVASAAMGFDKLGQQPGISDDGSVLAFWGDLTTAGATTLGLTPGPGIFACTREGPDFSKPFRVTGGSGKNNIPRADLGYDANRNPLYFTSDPVDAAIGVSHLHTGTTSALDGDSFIVCFLATPNAPSRPNPAIPGKPLLFSAAQGVWTVRVDIEKQLAPPSGTPPARVYHPWGAVPVAQIGDTLRGHTITQLVLSDPIARVPTDKLLNPRTEHRMDHQVVFWANTNNGPMIARGRYLDSDEDGLPDHWEQAGGGIDMDGDGVIDLDLHAMGADPNKRDLFMQIDWLVPNNSAGNTPYSNEPAPGATGAVARMFAAAPALANGIPAGITLHIDAGPGNDKAPGSFASPFSKNMGAGPLRGGNLIGQTGNPSQHVDVIYYGVPGQVPTPLTYPGVTTRAFQDVKDSTLLLEDKGARELAFRYAVLGDYQDFYYTGGSPATGVPIGGPVQSATSTSLTAPFTFGYTLDSGAIKITSGPGAGQIRTFITSTSGPTINIDPAVPWTTIPTSASTFVLLNDSSGRAEVYFQPDPDNASLPGNDILMSVGAWGANLGTPGHPGGYLANQCVQWRTLAHELGHSLGLRHSGIDGGINGHNPPGRTYNSLMSYDYQFSGCGSPVSSVQSYSGAGDPTFNDWANLKPEFHVTPLPIGVTTPASGFGDTPDVIETEATVADYIQTNGGQPDVSPPSVSVTSPSAGTVVPLNAALTVNVTATDNMCVTNVYVEFDANGDGALAPGETIPATSLGSSSYQATFSSVTGSSGTRAINAYATDCAGNVTETTVTIGVGSVISSVSVFPVLFDPAVRTCTITATGGLGLQPEARIKNGSNAYVRTVLLPSTQSGVYAGVWDGRDGTNAIVPAGTYTVEVWNSLANTQYTPTATVKVVLNTKIWRVNKAAPGPAHDGTSWATAFLKVQDGITAAGSGDDVWVAAGTYTERINLKNEVALYGGFAGVETARDQRNFRTNTTIVDGAQGGTVVTLLTSPTIATVLDGFTIRNGGLPNYGTSQGGGVYLATGAAATIANNTITGNRAGTSGGGLYLWSGAALVTNNTFAGNATIGSGGGMWIQSSTATVVNNLIVQNTAKSGAGAYLVLGTPLFLNNTVANNLALLNGGGVTCDNTTASLVNNIVSANSSGVFRSGAGAPSFASNCVWGNPGYAYSGIADPTGASGNISADPQFALAAFGNTHIQPTSPCVDTGTNGYSVGAVDIDGQPRVQNGIVDIGDDESDGSTWPTTYPIVRVSTSGNDGNDGSAWGLAKRTVQAAINTVAAGGEVWVQAGTYAERITPGAYDYMYGGFSGTETSRAQRNPSANATILDGGAGGSVVTVSAPGFALESLDGFTVRNGTGALVQGITSGGGFYCRDSAPVIANCTITANNVMAYGYGGGGLAAYYAAPSVANCTFTGNTVSATGGAVSGYYSAVTLTGCNISNNTSGGLGGGVYSYQTALTLSGGSINGNASGGNFPTGIYCDSQGSLTCSGLTVTGNNGDGIVSVQSPTSISSCTINGQIAGRGIYVLTCPSVTISGNTIWGNPGTNRGPGGGICVSNSVGGSILGNFIFANTAQNNATTFGPPSYPAQVGGGIYVDSPVTVANNAIYGNLANGAGGGVYCALGSPTLANNTIAYNNAVSGGGVCFGAGASTLTNTIVAFNSSGVAVAGGTATFKDNCVYGNTGYLGYNFSGVIDPTGTNGNISADPLLASALTGDVHIQAASPCRDAGDSTAVQTGWTDVYGQPRIQGAAVDIGAEESPGTLIPPVTPPIVFVKPTGSDANSGATWVLAKQTLAAALTSAISGDEIWAAAGTYSERITLKSGVALLGGFSGTETLQTQRNVSANVTTIDGGQGGSVVTAPPSSLPSTALDGFTLRNGTGTRRSDGYAYGGGLFAVNASPTIANCTFAANSADKGAALYVTYGAPVITNLTATGNTAAVQAAVQFNNAMAYLTGGSVSGNTGSGLWLDGNGKLYANGLTVAGNSARGIFTGGAVASIGSCTVSGNTGGSGIYLTQCPLVTVTGCTISGNSGTNLGAGLYVDSTTAGFIGGNTITGNSSSAQGGGMIVLNNTALTVANNLFQANYADTYGGGVYVSSGACQFTNNTLVQNTSGSGGGVVVSGGTPALANNIMAFNTSGLSVSGGTVSLINNCVYSNTSNQGYNYSGVPDPTGTNGNISADPAFANIAVGNVRIQGNSPCVDAGDPGSASASWTDLYGQPRVQGVRVDIGAAESNGTIYPPPVSRIVYISKSGNDANTGLSWAQAKLTIGAATAMALPGDEIWTEAGTYTEHIVAANGAALYGGFAGSEAQRSARNVQANPTTIDGGGTGSVVAFPPGALPSTTIDGFTIRNGAGTVVPGYGTDTGGGGILIANTSGTIANCTVTQNNATYGSGIFSWRSNATISSSTISQNLYEGVAIWSGNATLSGVTVASNAYDGIAVSNTGTVSVSGSQVTGNGHIGIDATGGNITVTGSTIANQTTYGGLYLANCASLLIQGCTISGNAGAPSGGGIYAGYPGTAQILNNVITGNTTTGDGGALWVNQGAVVANNLITSNGASGNGGGIYDDGGGNGSPSIVNNTLTGNFAVGGALHVNAGAATIANDIVYANSSGIRVTTGTPIIRNNCVYSNDVANYIGIPDQAGANGNISVDPQVLVYGPQTGRIQSGSPCVNAGDSSFVLPGWTDIDGQPRIQGGRVDIGADESSGATYVPISPPVVYVNPSGNDANDGSSWGRAKKTIGAALTASQTDGEIWVAAGTYPEHLTLKNRVSLFGGFAGTETLKSQRNWTTNVAIVDGGGTGSVGILTVGAMRSARIDGLTLRNGAGTLTTGGRTRGGAVSMVNAALALANCTISGNTTSGSGGGVSAVNSSLALSNCTVTGNTAGSDFYNYGGGGVYGDGATVGITGGSFASNNVTGSTLEGGAVCGVNNATVLVTGSTFTGNLGFADTVQCRFGSSLTVTNSTISNNASRGVSVDSGPAVVTGCTIASNGSNGVYLRDCPTATIQNCRITGNMTGLYISSGNSPYFVFTSGLIADNVIANNTMPTTPSFGGGGLFLASNQRVVSNAIYGNTSSTNGGGIYIPAGSPQVLNNTIVSNTSAAGGGICLASGTPTAVNNIVALNSSGVTVQSGTMVLRNNDVFSNSGGNYVGVSNPTGSNGNISADPSFANAASNDYRLKSGSPCIDTGDDSVVEGGDTDLDLHPRIAGAHVDIGAYEFGSTLPFTLADAVRALRISGGVTASTVGDVQRLNAVGVLPSTGLIDVLDAVRLARKVEGLESNP